MVSCGRWRPPPELLLIRARISFVYFAAESWRRCDRLMPGLRPHRLAAKDATLSRWRSRVRIPLGPPAKTLSRSTALEREGIRQLGREPIPTAWTSGEARHGCSSSVVDRRHRAHGTRPARAR